jgi:hypothetical protein
VFVSVDSVGWVSIIHFFGLLGGVSRVSVIAFLMNMLDHSIPGIFMDEVILRSLSPTFHSVALSSPRHAGKGGEAHAQAFTSFSNRLATANEKLATGNMDLPNDLYDMMKTLSGFNSAHISFYYSYLVANPHIGIAFYILPFDAKIDWVVQFITAKFPEN